MTTTTATQINAQVMNRYAGLKFTPATKRPDTSRNHQRGARKTPRKRVIL
jgi:hypothetical protein